MNEPDASVDHPSTAPPSADEAASRATQPRESYGQVAVRGMIWTAGGAVLSRFTAFLTSLVLGWLLSKEDYGVYAVAIGLSTVVLTIRWSGIQKILIQRGNEYDQLAQPVFRISMAINLVSMLLLGSIGPIAARFFNEPQLVPLLWIIGASMPLSVPAEIFRAKLSVDLRFRDVAVAGARAMLGMQALSMIFALMGFGPFSFAWPMPIVALLESILIGRSVGMWPAGRTLHWELARELFSAVKWIIPCGMAGAFIVNGANLVVSSFESPETTGVFFFGFQLMAAVGLFFKVAMHRVLMPTLVRLGNETRRQGDAYIKSVRLFTVVSTPICFLGVVVAESVIHFCWQGKWDESILVFRPLTAVLAIYMTHAIGGALLEARGAWRGNMLLHIVSAAGTLLSAVAGALIGDYVTIGICIALFRGTYAVFHGACIGRVVDRNLKDFLASVMPSTIICIVAAAAVIFGVEPHLSRQPGILQGSLLAVIYLGFVAPAYGLLLRRELTEIRQVGQLLRRGKPAVQ